MSLIRPIAPLPTIPVQDDMPRTISDPYAASCNPSREAKRLRSDSMPTNDNLPSPAIKSLPVAKGHSKPSRSAASTSPIVGPMQVNVDLTASKRRGRKPNTSTRAAREAQRKMNHSIIEKARRTKINDALATLRVLVPAQKRGQDEDDDDYELAEEGRGKKGDEKEFKLDVLVRTVSFLQQLTEKVKILEQGCCSKCGQGWSAGQKRKRDDAEEADSLDDETQNDQDLTSESDMQIGVDSTGRDTTPASNTRLPPIASWLPHHSIDPSHLSFNPNQSPRTAASLTNDSRIINQLPSPPTSTKFHPSIATMIPPALTLPLPRTPMSLITSTRPSSMSRSHPKSAKNSPVLSPTRTAEDESAASMLLHISSSSHRSSSSSERSYGSDYQPDRVRNLVQPLTPSSMLGLRREE